MKCPHCEKELPGSPCPKCGEMVPDDANYCMACGAPLKEGLEETAPQEAVFDDDSDFDLDNRVLCPDGACTGIIVDGKCTECGRAVGDDGEFTDAEEKDAEPTEAPKPDENGEAKKGE